MGSKLENIEKLKGVSLKIIQPEGDKRYMLGFDAKTKEEARVYNKAISFYLDREGLRPFHQVGHEGDPGYSAWEVWAPVDNERLNSLLPQIEKAAQILLSGKDDEIDNLYKEWEKDER